MTRDVCVDVVGKALAYADRLPLFSPFRRRRLENGLVVMALRSGLSPDDWCGAVDAYALARRQNVCMPWFGRVMAARKCVFYARVKARLTPGIRRRHLGWSSRVYDLEVGDLASLPDYGGEAFSSADLPPDEIILLIRSDGSDSVLRGRSLLTAKLSAEGARAVVPVRIVFIPSIAKWNLVATLVRVVRNRYRYRGTGTYHMSARKIRAMGLERMIRTRENAYKVGGLRLSDARRRALCDELCESLKKGYDDCRPLTIMLCRTKGILDTLDQGHHRMNACLECNVDRVAVCFRAAGAIPRGGLFG